jgi:hypothetical protein
MRSFSGRSAVAAAGHPATPAVAAEHRTSERRRNGLRRARQLRAHVGTRAESAKQPTPFLDIEPRPLPSESDELIVTKIDGMERLHR